jgi:hypothetical protein
MPVSFGFHPAFRWPLSDELKDKPGGLSVAASASRKFAIEVCLRDTN